MTIYILIVPGKRDVLITKRNISKTHAHAYGITIFKMFAIMFGVVGMH